MPKWTTPRGDVMASLPGELVLIGAVLHQAVTDAQSARPAIRADAHAFLSDPQQVEFWTTLAGLDAAAFQARAAALLRPREA
jgi:hypothetical protein